LGAELPPEKGKMDKQHFLTKSIVGFFLHLWLDLIFCPERSESIGIQGFEYDYQGSETLDKWVYMTSIL
jgi:hypothetical protein